MKEKVNTSLKNLPSYEEYPFNIEGIGERVYTLKDNERLFVDQKTGEMVALKSLPKVKTTKHDGEPYTKVFKKQIANFKNLSVPGSNLLYLIISKLDANSPFLCVNEEDFFEHCGYAKGSVRLFYKAITELIHLNVIKKKAGFSRCFWVNANIIFNGDRTKINSSVITK